ncbi:hypothetical protein GCM10023205_48030 [Yinghuangia aomiensis]|uniref:Uncharacterized protein n=1 Tax=Yinghuangia aomiensis TaxID=676205 RepID=A0ABP9HP77_9ACTN
MPAAAAALAAASPASASVNNDGIFDNLVTTTDAGKVLYKPKAAPQVETDAGSTVVSGGFVDAPGTLGDPNLPRSRGMPVRRRRGSVRVLADGSVRRRSRWTSARSVSP